MKAWRLYKFNDLRLDEVPMPEVPEHWLLVKIKVVQPSVTDTQVIRGFAMYTTTRASKMMDQGQPVQLGHEYCGEVVEVGSKVTAYKKGDRVTSSAEVSCGKCRSCLAGDYTHCLTPQHVGTQIPGAFAEYISIPEWAAIKIPDGPTDNEVAAFQSFSSTVGSVISARISVGENVAVIGLGPIGLGILQVARLRGTRHIMCVDVRRENLDLAIKYGADITISSRETDPVKKVMEITGGVGADVVFESVGVIPKTASPESAPLRQAFAMVRPGGRVIQSGNPDRIIELDTAVMRGKKIDYVFPMMGTKEFMELTAFWVSTGRIQVGPQITKVLKGLENLPQSLEMTANKGKYGLINPAQIEL